MGLDFGGRKPLVILDRGYPSKDFIEYLEDKGIRYVMRVQRGFNSCIDRMSEGSQIIELGKEGRIRGIVFLLKSG